MNIKNGGNATNLQSKIIHLWNLKNKSACGGETWTSGLEMDTKREIQWNLNRALVKFTLKQRDLHWSLSVKSALPILKNFCYNLIICTPRKSFFDSNKCVHCYTVKKVSLLQSLIVFILQIKEINVCAVA